MFSQSADEPAADQSPAPIGMRELPPQPARPVMPTYPAPVPVRADDAPARADDVPGPEPEDSVIAKDDYFEGTFTSRGTVVVMGSVKGRIEAIRVRIEDGARVDADVIVDEAIIAGEFTGNLTCRERLEAHASGRINGRVETYKLMLHEGASVEGEMHMLTEAPRDASETIRGSAPLRGESKAESKAQADARSEGSSAGPTAASSSTTAPATKPAPTIPPSSAVSPSSSVRSGSGTTSPSVAKPDTSAVATPTTPTTPTASGSVAGPEASAAQTRSSIVETLRLETLRVAPRSATGGNRYSGTVSTSAVTNGARGRNGTTTTGF